MQVDRLMRVYRLMRVDRLKQVEIHAGRQTHADIQTQADRQTHRIFKVDSIVYAILCLLNILTFSKLCATYNIIGINYLNISMYTL